MKTIAITGATGFLGSHVLRDLLASGAYDIVAFKRMTSNMARVNDVKDSKWIEWVDIDAEGDIIRQVFSKKKISAVIHCATEYGRGGVLVADILRTNLLLPIKILDACVEFGVGVFINTDSYFNKPQLQYPYLLDYSLSKKSLLLWLPYFAKKIRIANMTLEHIFGSHDGKDKFVSQMVRQVAILRKESVDLSPGNQLRDFIYVDDVSSAYMTVLNWLMKGGGNGLLEFEVGTGLATSVKDFVVTIKKLAGSDTELRFGALPYREAEIMASYANVNALKQLGWAPKYDYCSGLAKLLKIERGGR